MVMDLEILHILKKTNKQGSALELGYTNILGEQANIIMPRKLIENKAKIKDFLLENNFPQQDKEGWKTVCEMLQAKEPTAKVGMFVNKTGFWNNGYLLANGSFIGPKENCTLFLESELGKYLPDCSTSGSLDDWKTTIAFVAPYSNRIMLAICAALSGSLLKLMGVESGGYHFYGRSSTGKTTLLRLALSTSGPDKNMQSWNSTETALEEIAYSRSDGFICLDELKAAASNPKAAAQTTTSIIYKLSMEKGKATANKYNAEQYTWNIAILSTGEDSLHKHAESGGFKRKPGEEVRVIDIPADAGKGLGILDTLPPGFINASECVKDLAEQVQQCHGSAQIVFLEKLVADMNNEDAEIPIKERIRKLMSKFLKDCGVDPNLGTEVRFANRFALAYAAGCLAVSYKVLPFSRKDVFLGISACYKAALSVKPESWKEQIIRHAERLETFLRSKKFIALESKAAWSEKAIEKNDGFGHTINKIPLIALKRNVVRNLIPPLYLKDVIDFCKSEGNLLIDAKGNSTRSITLNDQKVRFYCFVLPGDEKSKEAVKKRNQGYAAKKNSE